MGAIREVRAVKLFSGFIYKDEAACLNALKKLEAHYGRADFQSRPFIFSHTQYYAAEMGDNLLKKFVSFNRLIDPGKISEIKLFTNKIETRLSEGHKRPVNIDPGYLGLSKVVLATTKDYSHRIYLGRGIYAEITLSYVKGEFIPLEWTYPDYRSREYAEVFKKIREIYVGQIA